MVKNEIEKNEINWEQIEGRSERIHKYCSSRAYEILEEKVVLFDGSKNEFERKYCYKTFILDFAKEKTATSKEIYQKCYREMKVAEYLEIRLIEFYGDKIREKIQRDMKENNFGFDIFISKLKFKLEESENSPEKNLDKKVLQKYKEICNGNDLNFEKIYMPPKDGWKIYTEKRMRFPDKNNKKDEGNMFHLYYYDVCALVEYDSHTRFGLPLIKLKSGDDKK